MKAPKYIWADYDEERDGSWSFYSTRGEQRGIRPDLKPVRLRVGAEPEPEQFRVLFHVECGIKQSDSVDMEKRARLPFLPRVGDMVAAGKGDDHREVEQVYWSPKDGFEVFFKFEISAQIKSMKALGWTEEGA